MGGYALPVRNFWGAPCCWWSGAAGWVGTLQCSLMGVLPLLLGCQLLLLCGCVAFPCCCLCLHPQVPAIDCLAAHALSMLPTSRSLLPADPHAAWKLFCRAPPSAWQLRWARAACWAQSPWHQAHCCCPSADAAGERAGRPGKRGVTVLLLCCLRCAALLCCAVLQHPPPRCPLSLHARRPLIPRFAAHRDLALAGTWLWTTGW